MKTYTLHLPEDAGQGDPEALDRAVLVRDGFSFGAFLLTALWFFLNRLWLAGLGVLLLLAAFHGALYVLRIQPAAAVVGQVLLSLLIGLEANSLRRWTLTRRGRPAVDVVAANSLEEAETKTFTRWLDVASAFRPRHAAASRPGAASVRTAADSVIGFFPEAERPR